MSKMAKQLDLLDYPEDATIQDVIRIGNENNRRLQQAYLNQVNAILFKEWLYFTAGMKRWRMGPLVGYNPGRDKKSATTFVLQELAGRDWRNQSHWGAQAGGAEWVLWGGEYADA